MERIDLYRTQHEKSGDALYRGENIPDGYCAMVVFVCVFNAEGNMLIQQRDARKSWGNMWDVSAGGVVRSGEDAALAAARELQEELGIKKSSEELTKVLSIYYDGYIHEIFTVMDETPLQRLHLQKEEVSAAKWASKEEIHTMIAKGEFLSVYPEFIDLLFRMQTKKGILGD